MMIATLQVNVIIFFNSSIVLHHPMPNPFIKGIQHSNIDATASSNQTFLMCQLKSFYDVVLIARISCHVIIINNNNNK